MQNVAVNKICRGNTPNHALRETSVMLLHRFLPTRGAWSVIGFHKNIT
jgi:hypothetical protein